MENRFKWNTETDLIVFGHLRPLGTESRIVFISTALIAFTLIPMRTDVLLEPVGDCAQNR